MPLYRQDAANQVFGAGLKSGDSSLSGSVSNQGRNSLRYYYDSNDTYEVIGSVVNLATWKAELLASTGGNGDQVAINYDPNPTGVSTFNLCVRKGWDAPKDLAAAVGDLDAGGVVDDVVVTYTTPSTNSITTFNVQRATRDVSGQPVFGATCTSNGSANPNGSDNGNTAGSNLRGVSNGSANAHGGRPLDISR